MNTRRESLVLKFVVQNVRVVEMHMLMTVKEMARINHGMAFSRTIAGSTARSTAQDSGMDINAGMRMPLRVVWRKDSTSSAVIKPMLPSKDGCVMRNTTWSRPRNTGSIVSGGRQPTAGLKLCSLCKASTASLLASNSSGVVTAGMAALVGRNNAEMRPFLTDI